MLDHPSRRNVGKKLQLKSSVIESDSDSDFVVDLAHVAADTSRSERGRGRGRSRRSRGPQARGTSSRGRVSKKPPWSESASELYRPSDRRLSAK
jgi:hypothetical protein